MSKSPGGMLPWSWFLEKSTDFRLGKNFHSAGKVPPNSSFGNLISTTIPLSSHRMPGHEHSSWFFMNLVGRRTLSELAASTFGFTE